MRLLVLSNKSPFPPVEGASVEMYHFIHALVSNGHKVSVVTMQTPKFRVQLPENQHPHIRFEYVDVDTTVRFLPLFLCYLQKKSYHIARFTDEQFIKKLTDILNNEQFDVVFFETLFTTQYLTYVRRLSSAMCVYRSHNIEHVIWQRMALQTKNVLKKHYQKHVARTLQKYEERIVSSFDAVAAISIVEAAYYKQHHPRTFVLPAAFPVIKSDFPPSGDIFHVYFIGALNWEPNVEGLRWFIDKVMPFIESAKPKLLIHIAGRAAPSWVMKLKSPYIRVYGQVDDLFAFLADKHALIVPLLSGGGVRIKILEAMAAGKAVISTSIGAEGIGVSHTNEILIADTPEDFAAALIHLSEHPSDAAQLAQKAVRFMESSFSYQALINVLRENQIITDTQ